MLNKKEREEELMTLPKDVIIKMFFELEDDIEELFKELQDVKSKYIKLLMTKSDIPIYQNVD